MLINEIKKTLYEDYYENNEEQFSSVTSSHWRDYGRKTQVNFTDNNYEINAEWISAFSKKTFLRLLRNVKNGYLLARLMNKYNAQPETVKAAKEIAEKHGILFNYDHAKHVLFFDLLTSLNRLNTDDFICIIGDGHGFFGTLIKSLIPDAKIIFVNLGRNLLIDVVCFSSIFTDNEALHLLREEDKEDISNHSIVFLEAENYELMRDLPISLFINIASMQEMDLSMINNYFDAMRTTTVESYFYCVNREEKTLPDGSVIRFNDYPWQSSDITVSGIDGMCPWYQEYLSSIPPFWKPFDGPHWHRLIKLGTKDQT